MKAQDDRRAENLQGIVDAVGKGQTDAGSVGKKNILPSSFTGGRRYMIENFQDAVAISRVFGPPDLFTTFTCNPKWGEIIEALSSEPGQVPSDRPDLPVRVYHMKLNEYLHDIKSGEAFGPVVAVLHTVEFQKRGLPHAHILIWLDRKKREMAHQLLSEIHNQSRKWTVSVLVSRLWFYRGGTDSGPIKHMDLVVLDSQGNHMYVQIPPQAAERLKHELEEGKVYMMSSFNCIEAKTTFRAVESPFMIQFTRFSTAVLRPGLEADYPFCTYNLTPFQDIQRPSGPPARFLDVIGRITAVSDVIPIHSMHQPEPSNTRTIVLADLQGQEIKLVLWGDRAVEFEEEAVRAKDEKQAVIAIFVGTLPKMNQGVKGLSGSSACRWYIDEDLPVINDFRNRLGTDFKPIDNNGALVEGAFPTRVYADPIEMTVSDLLQLNPYENEEKRFICTVTVERLNPDQRWWFFSCSTCNKTSTMLAASQYRCTNPNCSTKDAQETYCLSLFARDDVAEAEFIMFDKVGKAAVGKPLLTLLKFRNPGLLTIQEIARVPMVDRIAPPEVTQVVGQKYKLLVSISKRSFATTSTQLSFQVVKIMETYKPELSSSAFDCVPGTSGASSSASLIDSPVPSELFTPNTPSIQQAQPGSSSGSLAIGYQTPTGGARTPTSKLNASLLSSASPGKSPCPTGSARRVLFLGDEKKTTLPEETKKKPAEADEENYDDKPEDPSAAAEGKDDKAQVPKNKRSSVAGKGTAGGKKTKQ